MASDEGLNLSFQKVGDLLIKCKLLNKKPDEPSNKLNNALTKVNTNRRNFSDFFETLNEYIDRMEKLRRLGYSLEQSFFDKINLKSKQIRRSIEDLKDKVKSVEKKMKKWENKLKSVDQASHEHFELNSLFGLNFYYLNGENLRHYLSYFTREADLVRSSLTLPCQANSIEKVDKLLDQTSRFHPQPVPARANSRSALVSFYRFKDTDNLFDLILRVFEPPNPNHKQFSMSESFLYFKRNQLLICSEFTSSLEVESARRSE